MVKGRFTVNPYSDLTLTPADTQSLEELVTNVLHTNIARYEGFVSNENSTVDLTKWKVVKIKDTTTVYCDKKHGTSDAPTKTSNFPELLMVGTSVGTMEDLVFGVCNPTLEVMRIKASYVDDISGAAVLATIIEPTYDDPFRSLVVKWMELDLPFHSTNLVQNRDYVYVEATGIARMSNGERVGYHILHSVNFPGTHELPNRVRASTSICGMWRQLRDNRIETYSTGLMDPGGDMIRMLVVPNMATAFLSSLKYAYCGQMRKLTWMLNKRYAEAKELGAPNPEPVCVTCSAPITGRKLGDFGKSSSSCRLCFGFVCGKCKIQKKLSFTTPDLELERRKVTFCAVCMNEAIRMNAADVARGLILDANKRKPVAMSHPHSGSDATTSSEISYASN